MKMIIGGKFVEASDGAVQNVMNPATGEVIDTIPRATKDDCEQALANAQAGFREWSATPLYKRIEILHAFGEKILACKVELTNYLVKEAGKPYGQAMGEVTGTAGEIENFIAGAKCLGGETMAPQNTPGSDGTMILTMREPMGIFVSVIPFNYPVLEVILNAVPALLMGNSVIIKPSSDTPLSNIRLVEMMLASGVPANAVQIVTGSGAKIGDWLCGDPRISGVVLTGSTEVGQHIASIAGKNLARLTLELGGNDALTIFDDADLDYAVEQAIESRIWNCGQICAGKKRILVPNQMKEDFIDRLVRMLKNWTSKIGDPADPETLIGPLASVRAANQAQALVEKAVTQGAKLICGGHKMEHAYFELTVLDAPKTADVAMDDEIFAPVWTVIGYDTDAEALEIANNSCYGLNAACIGKDISRLLYYANHVQAGTCVINGGLTSPNSWQPFGGVKKSGIGRGDVVNYLKQVTEIKTINICNAL